MGKNVAPVPFVLIEQYHLVKKSWGLVIKMVRSVIKQVRSVINAWCSVIKFIQPRIF